MSGLTKILLIVGGVVGIAYYNAYKAISKLTIKYKRITVEGLGSSEAMLGIWLAARNNGTRNIVVNKIDLSISINGMYIGKLINPEVQTIYADSDADSDVDLYLKLPITYKGVGVQLLEMFKNYDMSILRVYISGYVYFNGIAVPVPEIEVYKEDFKEIMEKHVLKVFADLANKSFSVGTTEKEDKQIIYITNVI